MSSLKFSQPDFPPEEGTEGVEVRRSAISEVVVRCTDDWNHYVEISPSENMPGEVLLDVYGDDGVYLSYDRAIALAGLLTEVAMQERRRHG